MPVLRPPHAGKAVAQCNTGCVHPPQTAPGLGPPRTRTGRGYSYSLWNDEGIFSVESSCCSLSGGGQIKQGRPGKGRPFPASVSLFQINSFKSARSVLLLANFLASALASKRGLHAFLLTGFQVKGVALYFFDDVFLLHFALETAQSVFEGFPLLQSNFRQTETPPNPSGRTE